MIESRSAQQTSIDQLSVNCLRMLSIDMVTGAASGHPGMPLGAAPMAYALWDRVLQHDPTDPLWPNRDRFVLSAGHGSSLLYSVLHLTGYDLSLADLRAFRQWGSKTPGHPEYRLTPGVDATTGPLGQGFANGVGMAIAEAYLAAYFNRPGSPLVDHFTYGIVGDGDLMEGIASEAASLAGHLKLGKLIYLYDDNRICLDGPTDLCFDSESVCGSFRAWGWQVLQVGDGNDVDAIAGALVEAHAYTAGPSLICVRTHLGFGSPMQDSSACHGKPFSAAEVIATKRALGWPSDESFYVPDSVAAHMRAAVQRGGALHEAWDQLLEQYRSRYPDLAREWESAMRGELPAGWESLLPDFSDSEAQSTRQASATVLNKIAPALPTLMGGAADVASCTLTFIDDAEPFSATARGGRNINFGVREHAMGAIVNGLSLHGGIRPFGSTFVMFATYMMNPIRMAALMELPVLFIFTHGVEIGEDGPTHQPIEVLPALRAIPKLCVFRPADAYEVTEVWRVALARREGPSVFILSRNALPLLDRSRVDISGDVSCGGYVLAREQSCTPDVVLLGTGSEVQYLVQAQELLHGEGLDARVVSMPCLELFMGQPDEYRSAVLPPGIPRLAVEASSPMSWWQVVGEGGGVLGMTHFGASAPSDVLLTQFGFTPESITERARELVIGRQHD